MQQFRVKNALFLVFLINFAREFNFLVLNNNEKIDVDGRYDGLCYCPS